METSTLIAVQIRPGVFVRMRPQEAARYGYEPASNKAGAPAAVKKAAKRTKKKTEEVTDEPGDDS